MQGSSFRLIVRRGPQPNQIYELSKGVVTIGRDITNDIVINDPEVSRHHCRLTQGGGGFTIEDVGSTNGTFVNGQRLTGARPLSHNEMVGLGETVTLAYESTAQASMGPEGVAPGARYGGQAAGGAYPAQPAGYGQQPQGAYPAPGQPISYGQTQGQQPMGYEYDYQEDPYESSGASRWVVLGCGCLLVVCIVTSVIGLIIIDAKCWWDDLPVVSEMLDLNVREDATCR